MALVVLGSLPNLTAAQARSPAFGGNGVLQCWTDERGMRTCGDAVPPAAARRERDVIDPRGVTKKVLPAQKTPEQYEAERRQAEEQERQVAYDRYLLQTYRNVGEIQKVRDERLATLDSRMALTQKSLADSSRSLDDLQKRADAARHAKSDAAGADDDDAPPPNKALARQIREFTKAKADSSEAIDRIDEERTKVAAQFDSDAKRFTFLHESAKSTPAH